MRPKLFISKMTARGRSFAWTPSIACRRSSPTAHPSTSRRLSPNGIEGFQDSASVYGILPHTEEGMLWPRLLLRVWHAKEFVNIALENSPKLGFETNSDAGKRSYSYASGDGQL